jgi:hypothetical protein
MSEVARDAIARSSARAEIVTIDGDAATVAYLRAECYYWTDTYDGLLEFWGTVAGRHWRVHVRAES